MYSYNLNFHTHTHTQHFHPFFPFPPSFVTSFLPFLPPSFNFSCTQYYLRSHPLSFIPTYVPLPSFLPSFLSHLSVSLCVYYALSPYSLHLYIQDGATALHVASQKGHVAVVHVLLERGADMNNNSMKV